MLFEFHLPHYFATKVKSQIEHLYASMAIGNLAQAMIALFEPIFLFQAVGLTVTEVLVFFAAVYAIYVVLIPFGAKIANRYGYAHAIFFSIPFQILFWLCLIGAQQNPVFLYFAPVVFAMQKSLFWPAFHASLASYANGKQLGREYSLMYAIINIMQILGPMVGGFLAVYLGPSAIFIVGSLIYMTSAIPLLWVDRKFISQKYRFHDTWEMYKKYPLRFLGYFGYAEELLVLTIWPIFIYLTLKSYEQVGVLVTIATLLATGLSLYLGIFVDHHSKRMTLRIGSFFYVLSWVARLPVVTSIGAFVTDSFSRTSKAMVTIPITTVTYERAEATAIMPYVVGFEQALAFAKFIGAVIGVIAFAMTGSFVVLFILGAIFSLFYFLV